MHATLYGCLTVTTGSEGLLSKASPWSPQRSNYQEWKKKALSTYPRSVSCRQASVPFSPLR